MELTVKLFATFRDGRFEKAQLDYPPGTTLADIVDALRIPRGEIGVMLVMGRHAELEHTPAPGDTVAIFPRIGGG
jgi:molybdopterin converting factor small subunit